MMEIVALARDDGWAIVAIDGNLWMLRPPYSEHMELTTDDIDRAIWRHGFDICGEEFDTLDDVIEFLKDVYVEAMEKRGIKLPTHEELKDTLKYASSDILSKMLNRAESEWIPQGKHEAAHRIATDIMEMTTDAAVKVAAIKLLAILGEANEDSKH